MRQQSIRSLERGEKTIKAAEYRGQPHRPPEQSRETQIRKYANQYDIGEYVELQKVVIMQESGVLNNKMKIDT